MPCKVLTVVGARPQFVKAAVVSHELKERWPEIDEVIVHTGQHYDYRMSQAFFDELDIPSPKANLGVSGGSHAEMTGRMMIELERTMVSESPDAVLLYGDTNSTLAGALVAAKLHIPVAHVEAGARTRSMSNPEEINRICVDHVAALLMACTEANLDNLRLEGLLDRSRFVGDPMYDAFEIFGAAASAPELVLIEDGSRVSLPGEFYYLTCHREENTGDSCSLSGILAAMERLDAQVVYPVHPRNARVAQEMIARVGFGNVLFVEPVSYLESLYLVRNAKQVVTDSGGLQREAFFAGVKCVTVLPFEVWPETMVGNRNMLSAPRETAILEAMSVSQDVDQSYMPFGDGNARSHIARGLWEMLEEG